MIAADVDGVRVVSVYVPNGQSVGSDKYAYKLRWLEALAAGSRPSSRAHPRIAVLGDFNIAPEDRDVHDPRAWAGQVLFSEPERAALRGSSRSGFADAFRLFEQPERSFTWWDYRMNAFRRKMGLRIDHVLLSPALAAACRACTIDSRRAGSSARRTTRPWSASSPELRRSRAPARPASRSRALDELVRRARRTWRGFPIAWLSFFDGERERLRARVGRGASPSSPPSVSFALAASGRGEPLFVEDAARHAAGARHPLVGGRAARALRRRGAAASRRRRACSARSPCSTPSRACSSPDERTALANLASLAVARVEALRDGLARDARPAPAPVADRLEEEIAPAPRGRGAPRAASASSPTRCSTTSTGAFYLVSRRRRDRCAGTRASPRPSATPTREIGAMSPMDFISPSDREAGRPRRCARCSSTAARWRIEAEIVDRAGNVRPYALTGTPVRLGGRIYMIGIGARHHAAQARRAADGARQGAPRPRAHQLEPRALGLGPASTNRVYFNENWAAMLGDPPRESTFPGDEVLRVEPPRRPRGVPRRARQRGQGRERGVRLRVPRAQRRGRVDLGALARQGHAARRRRARRCA